MSGYAITAQFYDAMAGEQHAVVDADIAAELTGLKTDGYPVVDIGAGTGLTTKVIAKVVPDVQIFAIEPDAAMRPALMTRVWSDPDLRQRVSILPMPFSSAPLPPVISAAVASASLVHFSPQDRRSLWMQLFARLSPSGLAIVEIQCPVACDIPETCMATASIGNIAYEGWATARRIDDARQHWQMTYVARFNGAEIDRQTTDYICWTLSGAELLKEAASCGLSGYLTKNLIVLSNTSRLGE